MHLVRSHGSRYREGICLSPWEFSHPVAVTNSSTFESYVTFPKHTESGDIAGSV